MIKYLTLALALTFAVPSYAGDHREYWDWALGTGNPTARKHVKKRRVRHYRSAPEKAAGPKVMAYEKRSENGIADNKLAETNKDDELKCLGEVRGLGTQWIGTNGAMNAAKKDWMERVRYDHGESYIDMTNAKDFQSRCGRTSIGEVAGQVTYRCEIVARPCKAPMKQAKKAD